MKIEKVTGGTIPPKSQILNSYSESKNNTYSCDYINKLNNYSEEEIRIGTWFGKPLYRKVIVKEVNARTNATYTLESLGIVNQDHIIIDLGKSSQQWDIGNTGGSYNSVTYYISSSDYSNVQVSYDKKLTLINQTGNKRKYFIVLEYTKTTD